MSEDNPHAAPHAREIVKRLKDEAFDRDGQENLVFSPETALEILHEWETEIRAKPHMVKIPSIGDVS